MKKCCKIRFVIGKYSIYVTFLLVVLVPMFCNASRIDSLKNEFNLNQHDSKKLAKICCELSKSYVYTNFDTVFKYAELGIKYAEESNQFLENAGCHYYKSLYFDKLNEFDRGLQIINAALYIKGVSGNDSILTVLNHLKGSILMHMNNPEEAKKVLELAYDHGKKSKFLLGQAMSISAIAACLTDMGKSIEAVEYHLKTIKIYEELKSYNNMGASFHNIGNIYFSLKDTLSAEKMYFNAIETYTKHTKNFLGLINSKVALAILLKNPHQNDSARVILIDVLDQLKVNPNETLRAHALASLAETYPDSSQLALNYLNEAEEINRRLKNDYQLASVLGVKAFRYKVLNNCSKAIPLYKDCIEIRERTNSTKMQIILYKQLAECLAEMSNETEAIQYFQKYDILRDSVLNSEKYASIKELETKYETEKKECIITQQNLEIKNKNMGLGLVGGGLLGAIGLVTLLYRKRRQEQELNQLLDQQNRVLQDANQGLIQQLSLRNQSGEASQEPLMITLSNGSQSTVNIDDIQYFEAENNIVKIVLADGTVRHDYQRLKNFAELLKDSAMFIQIHRSYLVNVNHVTSHRANDLKMRSGDTLPIGITMKEKVHAKLKEKGV